MASYTHCTVTRVTTMSGLAASSPHQASLSRCGTPSLPSGLRHLLAGCQARCLTSLPTRLPPAFSSLARSRSRTETRLSTTRTTRTYPTHRVPPPSRHPSSPSASKMHRLLLSQLPRNQASTTSITSSALQEPMGLGTPGWLRTVRRRSSPRERSLQCRRGAFVSGIPSLMGEVRLVSGTCPSLCRMISPDLRSA